MPQVLRCLVTAHLGQEHKYLTSDVNKTASYKTQNKTPTFKTNTTTTRPSIAFDTPVSGVPVGVGLYRLVRENYNGNAMVKNVWPFRANTGV